MGGRHNVFGARASKGKQTFWELSTGKLSMLWEAPRKKKRILFRIFPEIKKNLGQILFHGPERGGGQGLPWRGHRAVAPGARDPSGVEWFSSEVAVVPEKLLDIALVLPSALNASPGLSDTHVEQ